MLAPRFITAAAPKPSNDDSINVHEFTVYRYPTGNSQLIWIMVSRNINQRNIELSDDVLEVVCRKITAPNN
jgi:hypothetical protein